MHCLPPTRFVWSECCMHILLSLLALTTVPDDAEKPTSQIASVSGIQIIRSNKSKYLRLCPTVEKLLHDFPMHCSGDEALTNKFKRSVISPLVRRAQ